MSQVRGSSILSQDNLARVTRDKQSNVFVDLMSSTFYTVMGYVCLDIIFAISLHFIASHNGVNEVAGLGLAFTTVNLLLIPMSLGTNQSLNVHSAQALGANRDKLAQKFFTMTIIVHLLYFIPLSVLLLALKNVIALTINEKDRVATSDACQTYLYYLLPSTLFAILYECMKSFMIAHKIFAIFMYVQIFTTGLHVAWCYLFIDYLDIGGGIPGAGVAIITTEVLNCIICLCVIMFTNYKHVVFENYKFAYHFKKDKKIFLSFLKTSLPIIAHIYADYFVFFLLNFIAISFGAAQLNAQLALSNTSNVYYKFPISLSLALMTYIGNEMGAKNIKRAQRYAWVGVVFFIFFTTVFLTLLTVFKYEWAGFYSADNEEITDLILEVYPIFVFGFFVIDGLQGTLTGILKGIERKEFVTYSTLLVYYLIGIPLVLYFAEPWGMDRKVYGIWFAFAIVNAVLAVLYLVLTFTTNWKDMSDKIVKRVDEQHKMQNLFDSLNKEILDEDENDKKKKKKKIVKKPRKGAVQDSQSQASSNTASLLEEEHKQIVADQQKLRDEGQFSLQETQQKQRKLKLTDDILPVIA